MFAHLSVANSEFFQKVPKNQSWIFNQAVPEYLLGDGAHCRNSLYINSHIKKITSSHLQSNYLPATPSSRTSPSSMRCTIGRTAAQMHAGKTAWGGCSMWWLGVCSVVFSSSVSDTNKVLHQWKKNKNCRNGVCCNTFGAGHRSDRPHGAAAERVVPVGVAGGAGGADGQTARCQVHHFFCWRDQSKHKMLSGCKANRVEVFIPSLWNTNQLWLLFWRVILILFPMQANQKISEKNIRVTAKIGGGSVMVWINIYLTVEIMISKIYTKVLKDENHDGWNTSVKALLEFSVC